MADMATLLSTGALTGPTARDRWVRAGLGLGWKHNRYMGELRLGGVDQLKDGEKQNCEHHWSPQPSVLSGGVLKVGVGYVLLVGGDLCKDNEVQLKDAEELWLSMA